MNASSSNIYVKPSPKTNVRREALRVRGHLAEVAKLIQHRVQLGIPSDQNAQSEAGKPEILAESPQLQRTIALQNYDRDIVLDRIVLEQLCERNELVLALLLGIR